MTDLYCYEIKFSDNKSMKIMLEPVVSSYHYKIVYPGSNKPMEILSNSVALQKLTQFIMIVKTQNKHQLNYNKEIYDEIEIGDEKYKFTYKPNEDKNGIKISYGKKGERYYLYTGYAFLKIDETKYCAFRHENIPISQIHFDKYE